MKGKKHPGALKKRGYLERGRKIKGGGVFADMPGRKPFFFMDTPFGREAVWSGDTVYGRVGKDTEKTEQPASGCSAGLAGRALVRILF
jgi:hypothetical protein